MGNFNSEGSSVTQILLFVLMLGGVVLAVVMWHKSLHIWLPGYILQSFVRRQRLVPGRPIDVMFCLADHYEPKQVEEDGDRQRHVMNSYTEETFVVDEWLRRYPALAAAHRDSDGVPVRHTWFFPIENYDPKHLEKLATLCRSGFGEVEVHLHHFRDTEEGLRKALKIGLEGLAVHGATVLNSDNNTRAYAFIHGNWSLDNARGSEWCGVNNELEVLSQTGCYADFTLPCAPNHAQTRKINAIYYATDDPSAPKSHNSGTDVVVGGKAQGTLMIIQGPLCLDWADRKAGIFPRIDNGEVAPSGPVTAKRIQRWLRRAIHVMGRPNWIFLKVHCHAGVRQDLDFFLGEQTHEMYTELERVVRDAPGYRLHYVTAREVFNIIKAAEDGKDGNPNDFRNYRLPPHENSTPMP